MRKRSSESVKPKSFDYEIQLIVQLGLLKKEPVQIKAHSIVTATLIKDGNEVELNIDEGYLITMDKGGLDPIVIELRGREYILPDLTFKSTHSNLNSRESFENEFSIRSYHSKLFNLQQESTFKAFFSLNKEDSIDFEYQFETTTYSREGMECYDNCISFQIDSIRYDITKAVNENTVRYIIECLSNVTFEQFRKCCFAIQQALGFVSGKKLGGEVYFFNEAKEVYYTNYIRPEIISSMYVPLWTNPSRRLYNKPEIISKYFGKLTHITPTVFSKLVSEILNSDKFSSAILLLLEASSLRSLLLIPSVFSVLLESLSAIVLIPETGLEYPIEDKILEQKVIDELLQVIENNAPSISDAGGKKLKRKIDRINAPMNKERLTNLEKLIRPFEQLGIALNERDLKVIEHRNDLLHGNILLEDDGNATINETNNKMYYVAARLYTLISKLILKHVGYEGYIYNHSKFSENLIGISSDEEYFDLI